MYFWEAKSVVMRLLDVSLTPRFVAMNLVTDIISLGLIENELLLNWCEMDPENRFLALAEAVQLCCSTPNETGRSNLSWSPLALELLSKAPKIDDILEPFMSLFFPNLVRDQEQI